MMTWRTFWDKYCILVKVKTAWVKVYSSHIQRIMATLIGGLSITGIMNLAGPIKALWGEHILQYIILGASVVIYIRAHWPPSPPPPTVAIPPFKPDPPPP
jgi:hypothetical protein